MVGFGSGSVNLVRVTPWLHSVGPGEKSTITGGPCKVILKALCTSKPWCMVADPG